MVMYDWESEFKTKEKRIWTKEKIAQQHLFTAFLSNFKGRNNSIQSTTVNCFFFFIKMTKSLVGFQVLNKVH